VQRTTKGDKGDTGAAGALGPAGPTGATGPAAFKLVVAPMATSLRAVAGARVKLRYIATTAATATLTVTKGTRKIATVKGAAVAGANAITWNGRAGRRRAAPGAYRLALRVAGADGQVATASARLRVR
jgi:hypothetical protein